MRTQVVASVLSYDDYTAVLSDWLVCHEKIWCRPAQEILPADGIAAVLIDQTDLCTWRTLPLRVYRRE